MAVTVPEMLKMSQSQLDDLFTQTPAGEIRSGQAKGNRARRVGHDLHPGHCEFH